MSLAVSTGSAVMRSFSGIPAWISPGSVGPESGRTAALSAGRVGRPAVPTQNLLRHVRAAGRSVGGTEWETPSTDFVSRSLETQSLLSTSLRLSSLSHLNENSSFEMQLVRVSPVGVAP